MKYQTIKVPQDGDCITYKNGSPQVPDRPIIPYIEGDGTGRDIWCASKKIFDAAINKAYAGRRAVAWMEVYAGEQAYKNLNVWLPDETVQAFKDYRVGIKGPLTSPISGGFPPLDVALQKALDLYICQRPIRYLRGVPSPVKMPECVDMVVFRENTEDIYTGIEFELGTERNSNFKRLLKEHFPSEFNKIRFPKSSGLGLKTISKEGSNRLVRAAINYALVNKRRSVTLVHKGNIMKYTEGAFRNWGYEIAEKEFGNQVYTWAQWERTKNISNESQANAEQELALKAGKLLIKDAIADIVFQQTITRPHEFDIIATMNLNGDYLSAALAAQVGGIGIAPEGNINYLSGHAVFEAAHDTDLKYADKAMVNPGSFILSGEMMFRYLGWREAADLIIKGMEGAITAKTVTYDFYRMMGGATLVKCSEFGEAVIRHMDD